ncbi:MAG: M43 family zinc metalloprotease, partial [Bacteroidota bacterium]
MAQQKRSKSERGKTTATIYEIPVVVHVIEPAEGALISLSNEQIVEQIKILTDDFRRFNDDASNTPSAFLPIAADTEIQFTLAKRDPAGNPTNGIVRKKGDRSNYNPLNFDHKSALRIISYWPPSHYLNIYVTNLAGFLGFASFPTLPLAGIDNEEEDLIFDAAYVDRRFFGVNENPTSFNSFGRTTTHEVGHYLGLRHIWGDGNCFVDDFVDDTPVADRDNDGLGLPCDFPNLDDNLVCDTDEMFQNYMDYTNDVCMNLFTTGQKDRMRTVLENAPLRIPLVTSPALEAPARFENDLAIFKTNLPFQANCSSEIIPEVEVINYWTDPITSYDVTLLINGTSIETINQTTSLDSFDVETITFPPQFIASTPSTITFEISNVNAGTDGNESNNSKSVTLTNTSSILTPYVEDFESTNTLIGDFGPTKPWEVMTAPTENPNNQALAFKAYNNTSAFDDATLFKTPIFDLTGIVSAGLVFRYAYARAPVGFRDGLAIKISRDCGATFSDTPLYLDYGDSLETATESATLFTPSGELDWKKDTISLVEAENNSNLDGIQFAFIGLNGGGNNIYLDDISVVQVVRNENDASLIGIEAPLVTCNETTSLSFDVRNVGFEAIDSIQVVYEINDSIATQTLQGEILTDKIESFSIDVPIQEGTNELTITLTEINGKPDEGPSRNSLTYVVNRDNAKDRYPLVVDFEYSNNWVIRPQTAIQLWSQDTVTSSRNIVLKANGFNQPQNGIEDWFISPELLPNEMDTAG